MRVKNVERFGWAHSGASVDEEVGFLMGVREGATKQNAAGAHLASRLATGRLLVWRPGSVHCERREWGPETTKPSRDRRL